MVAIDGTVVTTALSTIHRDLRASLDIPRMDGQRIRVDLRCPAADRVGARRAVRAAADVRDRTRDLHALVSGLCNVDECRRADHGSDGAGRRRGDDPPARHDPTDRGLSGRTPWAGARHLRRPHRRRRMRWAVRRWRRRAGPRLAVDLLDQRSDRRRGDLSSRCGRSSRAAAATLVSISSGSRSSPPAASASYGPWSAVTTLVGTAQRPWVRD